MTGGAREPSSHAVSPDRSSSAPPNWADLARRVASGLVLMAAALTTTWFGGLAFDLFWLAAGVAIFWEWQRLNGSGDNRGQFALGALALLGATSLMARGLPGYALGVLAVAAAALAWSAASGKEMISALGVCYAGALVLAVCLLRQSGPDGAGAIYWLFAVVWGTDSMAYFGGRLIGGPKLWPRVSPSKTWSGFVVGIVSGALLGWGVSRQANCGPCMLVLGLVAGALAQAGDLFESALKRRSGAKDAGGLIPGHGGVMDRLDGFIVASAFAASFGVWRAGIESASAGMFNW